MPYKMKFRRIFSTYLMGYQPVKYWKERGKVYQKEFVHSKSFQEQEKVLVEYLKQLFFDTVLEFGCGFGRITKLLLENFSIKKYDAFDLSSDQIKNAQKFCKKFKNVNFSVSTIQDFKSKEKYNIVLGTEVLLHVIPKEINRIISHLVTFSDSHMINIDWSQEDVNQTKASHNFLHDYKKIYNNINGVQEVKKKRINEEICLFDAKIF